MDHNVKEAWALGYTGKGIVVTILDDGLERTHPDISPNYVSSEFHGVYKFRKMELEFDPDNRNGSF